MTDRPSQIGDRIRRLREQLRLTQASLAKRVGVHELTVQRWESGDWRDIKSSSVTKLAAIFGISTAELMGATAQTLADTSANVSRGTSREGDGDAFRALRLIQNDVERQLIERGASEESVRAAGTLFTALVSGLRGLLAGDEATSRKQTETPAPTGLEALVIDPATLIDRTAVAERFRRDAERAASDARAKKRKPGT